MAIKNIAYLRPVPCRLSRGC